MVRQRSFSSNVVEQALRAAAVIDQHTELVSMGSARGAKMFSGVHRGMSDRSRNGMQAAVERHRGLFMHQDSFDCMQAGLRNAESVRGVRV